MRRIPLLFRLTSAGMLVLILGACTPGGQFDPTILLQSDMFDTKKKLQGDREPVFPGGVPGTTTGVPPDLVKGYQPPPDQTDAADGDTAAQQAPPPAEKPSQSRNPGWRRKRRPSSLSRRRPGSALAVSQARRRSLRQAHRSKPKPLAVSRSQFGRIRRNPRRLNSSSSRNRSGRIRRRRLPTSPGSGYCFSPVATFDAAL